MQVFWSHAFGSLFKSSGDQAVDRIRETKASPATHVTALQIVGSPNSRTREDEKRKDRLESGSKTFKRLLKGQEAMGLGDVFKSCTSRKESGCGCKSKLVP